ncbi:DUF4123 domain-containing protein [Aidingimonas halophila]|uniref:DUF4123 domain-containing protein n=1 Tax=Aidingimonas halophila TaxID=574349 RepID=A0A1H3FED1_9GAMM|nr:DUF4123 domain-containing protein [Aidingimonas halophila]GHC38039.1 hypothetical protein GCM10008094_34260 [Aidingimonas halophila]SDX89443.1 protein of unknown function [Aidingimonas halophila]
MGWPARVTHVLVDGVRYPDALRRLYARDDLAEIEPLYLLTRFKEVAEQGPILVMPRGRHFVDEILAEDEGERTRAMSLLSSSATTESLGEHLLGFAEIEVNGASRLLRFADPLVLRHWLASYGERVPAKVMGPIDSWHVPHWAPAWDKQEALTWRTFDASEQETPDGGWASHSPDDFAKPQRDALDAVARWQFKERLSAYFSHYIGDAWSQVSTEVRGTWLDARLDEALAWGAQTERQLAIWMELSLRWGEDFMTAPGGLYARWMECDATRGGLPRQQQLYELDAWCRSAEVAPVDGNSTTRTSYDV